MEVDTSLTNRTSEDPLNEIGSVRDIVVCGGLALTLALSLGEIANHKPAMALTSALVFNVLSIFAVPESDY